MINRFRDIPQQLPGKLLVIAQLQHKLLLQSLAGAKSGSQSESQRHQRDKRQDRIKRECRCRNRTRILDKTIERNHHNRQRLLQELRDHETIPIIPAQNHVMIIQIQQTIHTTEHLFFISKQQTYPLMLFQSIHIPFL